jgi:hypothetical protein
MHVRLGGDGAEQQAREDLAALNSFPLPLLQQFFGLLIDFFGRRHVGGLVRVLTCFRGDLQADAAAFCQANGVSTRPLYLLDVGLIPCQMPQR